MGQTFIKPDANSNLTRKAGGKLKESSLHRLVSTTENNQLRRQMR